MAGAGVAAYEGVGDVGVVHCVVGDVKTENYRDQKESEESEAGVLEKVPGEMSR